MKKKLRQIKFWLLIVWLSAKSMFRINGGDRVIYQGKIYVTCNGGIKTWRLGDLDNGNDGWVPESECEKVKTISNYKGSFKFMYNFYMVNWFGIWTCKGIESWMRGLSIW